MRRLGLLLFVYLVSPHAVMAHGAWPDNPYNYLAGSGSHPPPGAVQVVKVTGGRVPALASFTADGQAQIDASARAFRVPRGMAAVRVHLQPVPAPGSLPPSLVPDGNAYRISVLSQPGGVPVGPVAPVDIILKWAHRPTSMWVLHGGHWTQLCAAGPRNVIQSVVICRSTVLGTFLLSTVLFPSNGPHTPFPWLDPYLPMLTAVVVIAITAAVLLFVSRPDLEEEP